MHSILKKTFLECDYQIINIDSDYKFYGNLNQEYFMTIEYSVDELNNFFVTNKTDELLDYFEAAHSERMDVKKNTTLYILVETDNIEKFYNENKNTIFKIEEDQYYFRKHIIVYTKNGISNINTKRNISSQLNTVLMEEGRINNFVQNYYEDEEYFIAIQLISKIPFLVIQHDKKPYESLLEKVNHEKEIIKIIKFTDWLNNRQDENYMEKLETEFFSESDDTKYLKEFFLKYEETIK